MFCHEIANKSIENLHLIPKKKQILKLAWELLYKDDYVNMINMLKCKDIFTPCYGV